MLVGPMRPMPTQIKKLTLSGDRFEKLPRQSQGAADRFAESDAQSIDILMRGELCDYCWPD
ncbi:MAG: hypothetical protein F6J93_03910 [Oscillatoria sp. SIO1A7]|nr:hypothetical protein [Oscillatoria sp. SIO1A7]